jgi:hypothetical protein
LRTPLGADDLCGGEGEVSKKEKKRNENEETARERVKTRGSARGGEKWELLREIIEK